MPPKRVSNNSPRRSPRAPSSSKKHVRESSSNNSEPKRKKTSSGSSAKEGCIIVEGRKIDKYCWLCHQIIKDPVTHSLTTEHACVCCQRNFHGKCLEKVKQEMPESRSCPECQKDAVDGTKFNKYLSIEQVKELLLSITDRKIENNQYKNEIFLRWPPDLGSKDINRIIDLEILVDKINDFVPYTKPAEFLADVKYIYHNCYIIYGADSILTKAADSLVKEFRKELLELEACPECYYHMYSQKSRVSDFFIRLCDPPHDIIWAQVSGYPSWPAKCLKVINGNAHVRFFGKHEVSNLPLSQCNFISREYPKGKRAPTSAKYKDALEELQEYICIYQKKFGRASFKFYPQKTPYKPGAAEEENAGEKTAQPSQTRSVTPHGVPLIDLSAEKRKFDEYSKSHPGLLVYDPNKPIGRPEIKREDSHFEGDSLAGEPLTITMTFSEDESEPDFNSSITFTDPPTKTATPNPSTAPVVTEATSITSFFPDPIKGGISNQAESNSDLGAGLSLNDGVRSCSEIAIGPSMDSELTVVNSSQPEATGEVVQTISSPLSSKPITPMPPSDTYKQVPKAGESQSAADTKAVESQRSPDVEAIENRSTDIVEVSSAVVEVDDDDDDVIVLESSSDTAFRRMQQVLSFLPDGDYDAARVTNYIIANCPKDKNQDAIWSLYKYLQLKPIFEVILTSAWTISQGAPNAPHLITKALKEADHCKEQVAKLKSDLAFYQKQSNFFQAEAIKYQKEISLLNLTLAEEKRKNDDTSERLTMATQNARLVVDNLKSSNDTYWTDELARYTSLHEQQMKEKEQRIHEYEQCLEKLKADYSSLEAEKQEIEEMHQVDLARLSESLRYVPERAHTQTQTYLTYEQIYDEDQLQRMLDDERRIEHENRLKLEQQRQAEIDEFKRNDYTMIAKQQTTSVRFEIGHASTCDIVNIPEVNHYPDYSPEPTSSTMMYATPMEPPSPGNMPLNLMTAPRRDPRSRYLSYTHALLPTPLTRNRQSCLPVSSKGRRQN